MCSRKSASSLPRRLSLTPIGTIRVPVALSSLALRTAASITGTFVLLPGPCAGLPYWVGLPSVMKMRAS